MPVGCSHLFPFIPSRPFGHDRLQYLFSSGWHLIYRSRNGLIVTTIFLGASCRSSLLDRRSIRARLWHLWHGREPLRGNNQTNTKKEQAAHMRYVLRVSFPFFFAIFDRGKKIFFCAPCFSHVVFASAFLSRFLAGEFVGKLRWRICILFIFI